MSDISLGANVGVPIPAKTEATEKKTVIEKTGEFFHDKTKKGTLVGDHYVAAGALGTVGVVATVAGVAKVADKVPAVAAGLKAIGNNMDIIGGGVLIASSVALGQDAKKSLENGKSLRGGVEVALGTVAGLGGTELLAERAGIPVLKDALSGPAKFVGKNAMAIVGAGAAAGGIAAGVSGVNDITDGKTGKGAAKTAAGLVATLGGAELIGRQFNIPYVQKALTGPAQAIFTSKGGLGAAGVAIAGTGVAAAIDGTNRLLKGKGVVNDAIGVTEVTASIAAATGGASLVGVATGSEKLKQIFPQSVEIVGGVALAGAAYVVGKNAVQDGAKNGVTLSNTAKGTAAALLAVGSTHVLADKVGVTAVESVLKNQGYKTVAALGLGVASVKMGSSALKEIKDGKPGNALGQGAGAVLAGATSLGLVGSAYKIPGLQQIGDVAWKGAEKVVEPVVKFAVTHPGTTLAGIAVAGGAGAYLYYHNKKD